MKRKRAKPRTEGSMIKAITADDDGITIFFRSAEDIELIQSRLRDLAAMLDTKKSAGS